MTGFTPLDVVVLVLYFGSMAALGPFFLRKSRTTEGYLLGDRQFPGWLLGFSMFATSISSISFVAYPADAYKTAWFRMALNFTLPFALIMATFFFLPFFRRNRITSAYEYLEGRFGPNTRVYAAIAFTIMQVVRVSLILFLVAVLIKEMTGLDPYVSILLGGIITSFYTVMGGIRAVVWTDFIQAMVLFGGGLVALFIIAGKLPGGFGQIFGDAMEAGKLSMSDLNKSTGELEPVPWAPSLYHRSVIMLILVGLGNWMYEYSANQNVIQRIAASRSAKDAKIAMWMCCAFSLPAWALFMMIGTALWVFYHQFPDAQALAMETGDGGAKAESILPYFVINELPPGLTGLVIAGVLAAAMSSLSSSISAVSSVMLVDVYKRHLAPGRDDQHYVLFARLVGVAMAVIMIVGASILWMADSNTLQDSATVLNAITSGGLLGLFLLGFFTKVGDDRAALIGIGATVLWTAWMTFSGFDWFPDAIRSPFDSYYTGLIGHILMFIIGYGIGKMLPRRDGDLRNLTVYTQDDTPLD